MIEAPIYTLDASVAVKWLLQLGDEPHLAEARRIARDYHEGRVQLIAPQVLPFEVGHAVQQAVRRKRVTEAEGQTAYRNVLRLEIPLSSIPALHHAYPLEGVWEIAQRFDCSFYDAAYVQLAFSLGAPLLHADARLRSAMATSLGYEKWIEDYRSP